MPAATRAGHGTSQEPCLFSRDPQVEGVTAAWILTGGTVHDAGTCKMFTPLHWSASLPGNSWLFRIVPLCPCLDAGHARMFQATHVPNLKSCETSTLSTNTEILATNKRRSYCTWCYFHENLQRLLQIF